MRANELSGKILLVHMPIAEHTLPNLGIEKLAAILRHSGATVDTLYGTLLFTPPLPIWLHHDGIAPVVFAPSYYGESHEAWMEILKKVNAVESLRSESRRQFLLAVSMGMQTADECIRRCIVSLCEGGYDAVGISIGFDSQRLPSAALAKAIKNRFPDIPVIAGGSACDAQMGRALLKLFPEFDGVVSGEADNIIVDVFRAVCTNSMPKIEGFTLRDMNSITSANGESGIDDFAMPDLQNRPIPDYEQYISQFNSSKYATECEAGKVLLYEGSRGCWYGKKNHCTFCGIRSVDYPYRETPTADFLEDIAELQQRWHPETIYLTDAILSRTAFSKILPAMAKRRSFKKTDTKFFAETKSNLTPSEVRLLALANVVKIQPGIETFLSSTLQRMRKGASGIQQIELLKWCAAFGIAPTYGILLGTPGETFNDQMDLADICGALHHLPPPLMANKLGIHRFSPYFKEPSKHGVTAIFPTAYQRVIYRTSDEELMSLCYEFSYTLEQASDEPNGVSKSAVDNAIRLWHSAYVKSNMVYFESPGSAVVVVESYGNISIKCYFDTAAYVLAHTNRSASLESLVAKSHIHSVDDIKGAIAKLEDDGVVICMDNRILNLALPAVSSSFAKNIEATTTILIKEVS